MPCAPYSYVLFARTSLGSHIVSPSVYWTLAKKRAFPTRPIYCGCRVSATGSNHFHVLIWGLSDEIIASERATRNLQRLWLRGFVDIVATDGHPKIATYLSKYLFKTVFDTRLGGQKAYSASRNIMRPLSCTNDAALGRVGELFSGDAWNTIEKLSEKTYETQWLGTCKRTLYQLSTVSS